jgi:hypothetical protein
MKKVFLILISIILLFVFSTIIWFNLPQTIQNSCGSEFNNIYKEYAEKGLQPDFCLDIDKMKIKFRENSKGFSSCYVFNGHKFDDGFKGVDYFKETRKIGSFYNTIYEHYKNQRQPILKGACVESFSVHTNINYCDLLVGIEDLYEKKRLKAISEKDWCVIKFAENLNDQAYCEETIEPDYYPTEEYCQNNSCTVSYQRTYNIARYYCYVSIAMEKNDLDLCYKLPKNISQSVDNLRNGCLRILASKNKNPVICEDIFIRQESTSQLISDCKNKA